MGKNKESKDSRLPSKEGGSKQKVWLRGQRGQQLGSKGVEPQRGIKAKSAHHEHHVVTRSSGGGVLTGRDVPR